MRFSTLLNQPADWMDHSGPHSDIVITSRIRLARNIRGAEFPGWATKDTRLALLAEVLPAVEALPEMKSGFAQGFEKLTAIQKQVLVERHLISREIAARSAGSAVVMNRRQTLSFMINEEDHLRMQSIRPGLDLAAAYEAADNADTALEETLDFAFDADLGYLTACPTNLGTAMRASAMLHLPGLVLGDQMSQTIQAVNKIGLAVRGIYGEGTESLANLFQISNQHTLGEREGDIIVRLTKVIEQIIHHEGNARAKLLEERPAMLEDQICRAYAILRHARIIASKEAMNLLSMVRLGADLGMLPQESGPLMDKLLLEIQPAHLQIGVRSKLNAEDRDLLRAQTLRESLQDLAEPKPLEMPDDGEADADDPEGGEAGSESGGGSL